MTIKLYNSLTRQKEEFKPIEEGKVKMYVCGPTVYNYLHIGNARPAIVFDTVRRFLEYVGYDVEYVLNFTDVDDKLIKAANELGEEVPDIAERFIKAYKEDVSKLHVQEAVHHPRVRESMLYGKTRKMEKSLGKVLGEKEDQGGISNVQLWRKNI